MNSENGPFWRIASRFRDARKILLLTALACAGIQGTGHAENSGPVQSKFLALSASERYWWYEGAFRTLAHLVALKDRKKGECVANWYMKDRAAKQKLIEDTLAKNPGDGETTIVLSLLTQACGSLT